MCQSACCQYMGFGYICQGSDEPSLPIFRVSLEPSLRAYKKYCVDVNEDSYPNQILTTTESRAKIWRQYNAFKHPGGLGCGSVAVNLLHCLWEFYVCLCFVYVMHYLASFAIILKRNRKLVAKAIIVLQMYCYYKCFVALSNGAVGWSAVCDCGIS